MVLPGAGGHQFVLLIIELRRTNRITRSMAQDESSVVARNAHLCRFHHTQQFRCAV